MNSIKMVVSDLDGTLLPLHQKVSSTDLKTFYDLKEKNIIRVIATGRSYYAVREVLDDDFPIDYLICSTGAGIYDWKTKELLKFECLRKNQVKEITQVLNQFDINYFVSKPIPDNHYFYYRKVNEGNHDFKLLFDYYQDFLTPLSEFEKQGFDDANHMLIILDHYNQFVEISEKLSNVKIIRVSSPLNTPCVWMEIFPAKVSKSHGLQWLCHRLGVHKDETFGIGNDFNDEDFLDWTYHSFVVSNAPEELKAKYTVTDCHTQNGFTKAVQKIIS